MAGEAQAARVAIYTEDGDVVTALIATIEELAGGVKVEAARIVAARPFFPDKCQGTVWTYGKDPDKALSVPSFFSPTRSVSLEELRRVPEVFKARQLGLVRISWTPAGVIAPVARCT